MIHLKPIEPTPLSSMETLLGVGILVMLIGAIIAFVRTWYLLLDKKYVYVPFFIQEYIKKDKIEIKVYHLLLFILGAPFGLAECIVGYTISGLLGLILWLSSMLKKLLTITVYKRDA